MWWPKAANPARYWNTRLLVIQKLDEGRVATLAEVEIAFVRAGTLFREKQKAFVWATPEKEIRNIDGLLGPAALGIAVVRFDFNRHTVSLEARGKGGTVDVPSNTSFSH